MFRLTNVPFDQCSIRPKFHSTKVPSTKMHSTKVFSTKVSYPFKPIYALIFWNGLCTQFGVLLYQPSLTERSISNFALIFNFHLRNVFSSLMFSCSHGGTYFLTPFNLSVSQYNILTIQYFRGIKSPRKNLFECR